MGFLVSIKRSVYSVLGFIGYRVSSISDLQAVQGFIEKCHPIKFELIRIGSERDGGYLVPNDLKGVKYCFSPGVSNNSDFEEALSKMGIPSFLADYSVDAPALENESFHFLKKFVGPTTSSKFIEFQEWVCSNSIQGDELILQMDIEGSEYASLLSCSREVLKRFRILIIEFHGLDMLFDSLGFRIVKDCFEKILQDFYVVHIHPNNNDPIRKIGKCEIPSLLEFSFIRKDRVSTIELETQFPHKLDRATVSAKKDFVLPQSWFTQEP